MIGVSIWRQIIGKLIQINWVKPKFVASLLN